MTTLQETQGKQRCIPTPTLLTRSTPKEKVITGVALAAIVIFGALAAYFLYFSGLKPTNLFFSIGVTLGGASVASLCGLAIFAVKSSKEQSTPKVRLESEKEKPKSEIRSRPICTEAGVLHEQMKFLIS